MKKSLPIILLSILVIVSVTGNILFYSKLKSANTENKSLTSSLEESQEILESLESEQKDLEEQLNNLETERKGLEEERNTLESELEFLKSIELLSKTMYAIEDGNVYIKPDESSEIKGEIKKEDELHVTGRTSNDWYRVTWGNREVYIKSSLLSDTKPTSPTGSSNSGTTNNNSNSNSGSSNSNTSKPSNPTPSNSTTTQEQIQGVLDNLFPGTGGKGGDLGDQGWSDL